MTNKMFYMHIFCFSYVPGPGLLINKARLLQFVIFQEIYKIYVHSCKTGKDTSRTTRTSE
jgi:hypothetical protein